MDTRKVKIFVAKCFPVHVIVPMLAYCFLSRAKRNVVRKDVTKWQEMMRLNLGFFQGLSYLLTFERAFRNLYYRRLGTIGLAFAKILKGEPTLFITRRYIGPGFFVRHGYGTFVNTLSIGENCVVHQNTTIGDDGKTGIPTIGDDVIIGTGALVLGGITIGNNVKIGAGAIVVEDVPSNSTVVGVKAKIIDRNRQ